MEYKKNSEDEILFFPNPVSSDLKINANDQLLTDLKIYDVSSKLIHYQEEFFSDQTISFSDMTSGVYFIEVKIQNSIKRQKVIK
ncbi:MAG: T9SS type A sorting domain-containing protein [Saprospiraceae bacterium]